MSSFPTCDRVTDRGAMMQAIGQIINRESRLPLVTYRSILKEHLKEHLTKKNARGIVNEQPGRPKQISLSIRVMNHKVWAMHIAAFLSEPIPFSNSSRKRPWSKTQSDSPEQTDKEKEVETGPLSIPPSMKTEDEPLHMDTVSILLEARSSFSKTGIGGTALHYASLGGHEPVIRVLLEAGADVHAQTGVGGTALLCAALGGHTEAVKVLLDAGSHVHTQSIVTGLNAAVLKGHANVVTALLTHANTDIGMLLHLAALSGQSDVVRVLLDAGCDVQKTLSIGKLARFTVLLGSHADPYANTLIDIGTRLPFLSNLSALGCAALCGNTDIVNILLAAGFDVRVQQAGDLALRLALLKGNNNVERIIQKAINLLP